MHYTGETPDYAAAVEAFNKAAELDSDGSAGVSMTAQIYAQLAQNALDGQSSDSDDSAEGTADAGSSDTEASADADAADAQKDDEKAAGEASSDKADDSAKTEKDADSATK